MRTGEGEIFHEMRGLQMWTLIRTRKYAYSAIDHFNAGVVVSKRVTDAKTRAEKRKRSLPQPPELNVATPRSNRLWMLEKTMDVVLHTF